MDDVDRKFLKEQRTNFESVMVCVCVCPSEELSNVHFCSFHKLIYNLWVFVYVLGFAHMQRILVEMDWLNIN